MSLEDRIKIAVILVGGKNSRFFPLNTDTHKGAIKICGKPLVLQTIEGLIQAGVNKIYIVVSEKDFGGRGLSKEIKKFLIDVDVIFVLQKEALGMGDALLLVKNEIKDDRFVVCFPYSLDVGLRLIEMNKKGDGVVFCLSKTETPWLYGVAKIIEGKIVDVVEKPKKGEEPSNFKLQGLYVLNQKYLDILIRTKVDEYSFENALSNFLQIESADYIILKEPLLTLKYPWQLFSFKDFLIGKNKNFISESANVDPSSVVENSYLGDNVIVDKGVKIKNSIILDNCHIYSDINYSILASNVYVDRDVVIEYKNGGNILVEVKGDFINTGLDRFGTVLGSHSVIGSGVKIKCGIFVASDQNITNKLEITKNIYKPI